MAIVINLRFPYLETQCIGFDAFRLRTFGGGVRSRLCFGVRLVCWIARSLIWASHFRSYFSSLWFGCFRHFSHCSICLYPRDRKSPPCQLYSGKIAPSLSIQILIEAHHLATNYPQYSLAYQIYWNLTL